MLLLLLLRAVDVGGALEAAVDVAIEVDPPSVDVELVDAPV